MKRSLKDLEHYVVRATDGEVGRVTDFLLDDEHWAVRYLVVHCGDMLDGRTVLISPISFRDVDWAAREIHLALTMERVKGSPDIDAFKPVTRQHERDYSTYYGYPQYWNAAGLWGMGMYPAMLAGVGWSDAPIETAEHFAGDEHLRSAAELRHYQVQGIDDAIGHVADFLADDATWSVPYLVIDTSNWWFGKQVLIAPMWAHRISWEERNLFVDMTREATRGSPEWDGVAELSDAYDARLHAYYETSAAEQSRAHANATPPSSESTPPNHDAPNPPRTTSLGWFTAPKFGSAGSGGAEIEPGPERD
jgi:hypothetical protein